MEHKNKVVVGNNGPVGEPGPWFAPTEAELVAHLIAQLEQDERDGMRFERGDGRNHHISVDAYALSQAINALLNYQALLTKTLSELVTPCFFHSCGD